MASLTLFAYKTVCAVRGTRLTSVFLNPFPHYSEATGKYMRLQLCLSAVGNLWAMVCVRLLVCLWGCFSSCVCFVTCMSLIKVADMRPCISIQFFYSSCPKIQFSERASIACLEQGTREEAHRSAGPAHDKSVYYETIRSCKRASLPLCPALCRLLSS